MAMSFRWSADVTVEALFPLVWRAASRPASLARLLAPYDVAALVRRLGCEPRTALWLQLCDRPAYDGWQRDVDELAHDLGLDATRLEALLMEATAMEAGCERARLGAAAVRSTASGVEGARRWRRRSGRRCSSGRRSLSRSSTYRRGERALSGVRRSR